MPSLYLNHSQDGLLRVSTCACALLLSFSGALQAKVVYVDGSLSSNCSSSNYSIAARKCSAADGLAYTTLASGMNALAAGDTLAIRGGTYRTPLIITKSGTSSAPIKIIAWNGENVVIDMSGMSGNGVDAVSRQWIEVSGLTVKNSSSYGIKGSGGANITLSDCEVSHSYHAGLVFENASNISVRNCAVHDNNRGGTSSWHEAVSFENVDTFKIVNSSVYDNGKEGIDAKYNSRNGTIAYNRVFGNNGPNIYIDAAHSIDVMGNVCYDTVSANKACIGLAVESTYNPNKYPTDDIRIINNVIWGSGAGVWVWVESPSEAWSVLSNLRIEYNTIVDNSLNNWGGIKFLNGTSSNFSGANTIMNNIIMGNSGYGITASNSGILTKFAVANNLFASGETSITTGSQAVFTATSPFVDRSGKDFHLVSGAAARGKGRAVPDVSTDIEGNARPSSATDVGAYQYAAGRNEGPIASPTNFRMSTIKGL